MQSLQQQILQCCNQINEKCEVEFEDFCFDHLRTREWYLSILQILFPHLQSKLSEVSQIEDEPESIQKMIGLINDLDQFEKIEIDGNKVVNGDTHEISNCVQIIQTLLQIAIEQYEENEQNSHQNQQHSSMDHQQNTPKQQKQVPQKNVKQKKSHSDYSKPKSVQAIGNEFDDNSQEQQSEENQNEKNSDSESVIKNLGITNAVIQSKIENNKNQKSNIKEAYKMFPKHSEQEDSNDSQKMEITRKVKVNKQKNTSIPIQSSKKNIKKLITHPKSPQTLKKATSSDAIALTKKAQEDIKKTKKKLKKNNLRAKAVSPMKLQMEKKKREYDYSKKQEYQLRKQLSAQKDRRKDFSEKNVKRLQKVLNWRQSKVRKEKQQYEESIKFKISTQKEQYINKINQLIVNLEREKQIQEKKDFEENLMKENEEAVKKLSALDQWYKNKLSMLKQNRNNKKNQRLIIKTGHKQIIGQITKYLKKENEEKLMKMTEQYRNEQMNIENDFEELKEKIIKVYKKS